MKRFLWIVALFFPSIVLAQSTTVSGTVTDTPDGQTWNNGTFTLFFTPSASNPAIANYTWTGGALNPTISGTLTSSGAYSVSVPSNTAITPIGSTWRLQFCPQASSPCFTVGNISVAGGTQTVNGTPPSIRINWVNPPQIVTAYTDTEVSNGAVIGSQYYNLTSSTNKTCTAVSGNTCTTWAASGGGGGPAAAQFNVKAYGAVGDTQQSANASSSGNTITCTDCNFTSADLNKSASCTPSTFGTNFSNRTITTVTDSTHIVFNGGTFTGPCSGSFTWGTIDDTAVANAVTAFAAAIKSINTQGNLGILSAAPVLYFPTGNYGLLTTNISINNLGTGRYGLTIQGDGSGATRITALTGFTNSQLITISGNMSNAKIFGLLLDGMNGSANTGMQLSTSFTDVRDVVVQRFANGGGIVAAGSIYLYNVLLQGNQGGGFSCAPCNGEARAVVSSNNANSTNLTFTNVNGEPSGSGFKWYGGLIDECGTAVACTQVNNSDDVWFIGGSFYATPNGSAIRVDGTSFLHIDGGIVGGFNTDSNETALTVLTGGTAEAADARFISMGTGKCINNSGTFINNGANSCESMFASITAASSSSTTATLTANTQGANVSAVCTVGDSIFVQGVGVSGYNGNFKYAVTAVGTNTISYTTPGSNLASSSGGSFFCKGVTTFTGTLPYSTITPTPNTCYVTGTFGAITMCNQFIDRPVNIYRIKASSGVTTACTVAPVVTITDGTNSATLTITTAKSTWDSSVDASTNVGNTIYTPRSGTLTMSTTAGTCTTPPTNFSVTYTMQAVLDN